MQRISILLVDSSDQKLNVLHDIFSKADQELYALDLASDYEQACVQILADTHDIYFISNNLAEQEGVHLIDELIQDGISAPLILLNSEVDDALSMQALAKGAADYLNINALDYDTLTRAIRYAIYRKDSEKELRQVQRQHHLLLNSVGEGIIGLDVDECITFINPAAANLLDAERNTLIGKAIIQLLPNADHSFLAKSPIHHAQQKYFYRKNKDYFKRQDGSSFPIEFTITPMHDEHDDLEGYVLIFQDITLREKSERKLAFLAEYDTLTGLANRSLFLTLLPQILARSARQHERFALLFLDLDHFKKINDTWGHDIGDQLLKRVANRLKRLLRDSDLIVRLGGDEFTVVLESIKTSRAVAIVAQKIIKTMSVPFIIDDHELFVSVSLGIATYPDCANTPEEMIKSADLAMYHAKRRGRNCYQFFTEEINASVRRRLEIEKYLRHAVDNHEFFLHYQPQVNLTTKEITGFEALIRWENPDLGFVSPADFIPIAEESGMITRIGEWVLLHSVKQCKVWNDNNVFNNPVTIAVNVASHQLDNGSIVGSVKKVLAETELHPQYLELEVTESSVMTQPEKSISSLRALKQLGIRLAIDDFGTGYSSLNYLKNFPIDMIKIDQSFVRDIFLDPDDASIVKAIINLAHSLNISVIAEGVEEIEQLRFLIEHHCDNAQGFLMARPMLAEQIKSSISDEIISKIK